MSNDQLDRNFLSTKHKNEIGAAENNASEQFCPVAFNPTCVYRHGKHTLTLHQSRARSSFLPPASTLLDPVVALLGPGQTEEPRTPPSPPPPAPTPTSTMEDKEGDQHPVSEHSHTTIHPNISSGAAPTPRTCEETQTQKQKFCHCEVTHSHTPSPHQRTRNAKNRSQTMNCSAARTLPFHLFLKAHGMHRYRQQISDWAGNSIETTTTGV